MPISETNNDFPKTGLVRLDAILAPRGPIPVGRSTWWAGVKTGRFPQPLKISRRVTVWRAEDVRALFQVHNEAVPTGGVQS